MNVFVTNDCTVKSIGKYNDDVINLNCENGTLKIKTEHDCCEIVILDILNDYPLKNLIGKKIIGCELDNVNISKENKFYAELYEKYNGYEDNSNSYDVLKLTLENNNDFYIGYCVFSNGYYSGGYSITFKKNE